MGDDYGFAVDSEGQRYIRAVDVGQRLVTLYAESGGEFHVVENPEDVPLVPVKQLIVFLDQHSETPGLVKVEQRYLKAMADRLRYIESVPPGVAPDPSAPEAQRTLATMIEAAVAYRSYMARDPNPSIN